MKRYAIGDVHGMLDLLMRALEWIERDAAGEAAHVTFLGDYIDRGPSSAHVVEKIMHGPTAPGHTWTALKGNHEDMLVRAGTSDEALKMWWANGGKECLASYADGIPEKHVEWMRQLSVATVIGDHLLVHGCVDTGLRLDAQRRDSMLWGRHLPRYYAQSPMRDDDGKRLLVIHGHTPTRGMPDYVPGAVLNLDTGCCFGGPLSVAAFDEGAAHPRVAQFRSDGESVLRWNTPDYPLPSGWKVS